MDSNVMDSWRRHIDYDIGRQTKQAGRFFSQGVLMRDLSSYEPEKISGKIFYDKVKGMTAARWEADLEFPEKGNGSLYSVVVQDRRREAEKTDLNQLRKRDPAGFLQKLGKIYEEDFEITDQVDSPKAFLVEGVVKPRSIFDGAEYVKRGYIEVDETGYKILINLKKAKNDSLDIGLLTSEAARITKILDEYSRNPHRKRRVFGIRMEHGRAAFSVDSPGLRINRNPSYFVVGTVAALLDFMFF